MVRMGDERVAVRRDPLLDLLRAVGCATTERAAVAAAARLVADLIGDDATVVRLWRPDSAGRLRPTDPVAGAAARSLAGRRREVFREEVPVFIEAGAGHDLGLALLPLPSTDGCLGVLEIQGGREAVMRGRHELVSVAGQLSIALRRQDDQRRHQREIETLQATATLAHELLAATEPEQAIKLVVDFLWLGFRAPLAVWSGGAGELELVTTRGLSDEGRRALRRDLETLDSWERLEAGRREDVERRFARAVGTDRVAVADAVEALVLVDGADPGLRASLDVVGPLLREVLEVIDVAASVQRRDDRLDVGIAWTAHELRGPLLGVRAAIDLQISRAQGEDAAMLRRSLAELDQVLGSTEEILGWAVGSRRMQRRNVNVVRLVREAIASCRMDPGGDRIVLAAPRSVVAPVDSIPVRAAVANLVRNALAHSASDQPVTVTVSAGDDQLEVSVADRGSGVGEGEREAIFEAFVRGAREDGGRRGGLGLFIVRRVAEAHSGRVWVESSGAGATFRLTLPLSRREARQCAS